MPTDPIRPNPTASFASMLALTFGAPIGLWFLGAYLNVPGTTPDAQEMVHGSGGSLNVFALGVAPILTAYWVVEVVAFFVPRWSKLRHLYPEGRAKLDAAARALSLAFAAIQALGFAISLRRSEGALDTGLSATGLFVVTLVGGVCLQFLIARMITVRGVMNGLVVLSGASALVALVHALPQNFGLPWGRTTRVSTTASLSASAIFATAFAWLIVVAATWIALKGAGSEASVPNEEHRTAYRDALPRKLAPVLPIPLSSVESYFFGTSLLALPALLASFGGPYARFSAAQQDSNTFTIALIVTVLVLTIAFSYALHRPAELRDFVSILGAGTGPEFEERMRRARRTSLIPTLLYFLVLIFASRASRASVVVVILLVPVAMDLLHALRIVRKCPDWIPVWEDRRAALLPVLRSVLATNGIPTEVRGAHVLNFWQVFAPYAPGEILTPKEDAKRAQEILKSLLVGGQEAARTPDVQPLPDVVRSWNPSTRAKLLFTCALASAGAWALSGLPETRATLSPDSGPGVILEIVRVDDTVNPFASLAAESIPPESGIGIASESVSGERRHVGFARIMYREGETKDQTRTRFRKWLSTVSLPEGARFGFQEIADSDDDATEPRPIGIRTLILVGDSVLRRDDIVDALMVEPPIDDPSGFGVSVVLSADAAKRFEVATREWTMRRLAIVMDGQIQSAPVVRNAISGGRVVISMGRGEPAKMREEAARLERGLRPRRQ